MRTWLIRFVVGLTVLAALLGGGVWQWLHSPLDLRIKPGEDGVLVVVAAQSSAKQIARDVVKAGVDTSPWALYAWFRWSGQARKIQAGTYELALGTTPQQLLTKLVTGDQALTRVALLEGWTFARMRRVVNEAAHLQHETADWRDDSVMSAIGQDGVHPEGRFLPDTYVLAKNSSDLVLWRQAAESMSAALAKAWSKRHPACAAKTPEELLVLASMIEKETQHPEDRALVSAVLNNRLRIGMRLQSDPTIIYGLGEAFDGNIRKRDLTTDGPYNSYTRNGLPPTPIANPSVAALMAAAQPAASSAMYFVGKGDGTSHFSSSLREHNEAVRRYILKR